MAGIKSIVVFGVDGLRPDMVTPETMPVLAALCAESACSSDHRTVYPSETRCALTALACGARPEVTGILGNEFFARGAPRGLSRTNTIHDWRANEARLTGGFVTATSLAETLGKAGRRFAVVNSSGQGSATALNWKGDLFGHALFNVRNPQIAFPGPLAADIEERHGVPPSGHTGLAATHAVDAFTETVWPEVRPDVAVIWVTEVDGASHRFGLGAEGMRAAMTHCDEALARLLAWRDALPEAEDVTILVTSDHGHSTIGGFVSVADTLRAAGLELGDDIVMRRGRAPAFWLNGGDPGRFAAIAEVLADQPWVGALFSAADAVDDPLGRLPGTLSVALTGIGHRRAPDLVAHLAGNDDLNPHGIPGVTFCDAAGYGTPLGGGTHGGMHPSEVNAVFVAHGAGIGAAGTRDGRTGIQDIAPTILALLGVTPPPSMAGRVMSEFLADGASAPEVEIETFTARHNGRWTRLTQARVGDHLFVDSADHGHDGQTPSKARKRDDLVVSAA